MTSPSLASLTQTVRQALLAGGAIVKKGFSQKRRVSFKTPTSPVTQVDRAAEKKIISLIRRRFPQHTFLAEESAFLNNQKMGRTRSGQYRWVIDPLDGTVNFIHHIPQSCVSIAVEKDGVVLAGGVFDPQRNELFLATRGKGATLNGRRIHVSQQRRMRESLLITGFPYDRDKRFAYYLKLLKPFLRSSAGIRRFGSSALDLSWVACGRAEAYWECGLSPWDVAAGFLLVEEAGGKVTNFKNGRYDFNQPKETLATNGFIHRAMVNVFTKK